MIYHDLLLSMNMSVFILGSFEHHLLLLYNIISSRVGGYGNQHKSSYGIPTLAAMKGHDTLLYWNVLLK